MSTPAPHLEEREPNYASILYNQVALIPHNNNNMKCTAVLDDLHKNGSIEARINLALAVENITATDRRAAMTWVAQFSLLSELLKLVAESHSPHAVKAGIKALAALYHGSSLEEEDIEPMRKLKASDVAPLIEQLPGATRPKAERILTVLKAIAMSVEGQVILSDHALTLPTLVRSLLVLSDLANELAIHVLWLLCMHSRALLEEAAQLGVAYKLLVVLAQMNCTPPTKQRVNDLLKAMRGMSCLTSFDASSHRL